MYLVDTNIFLHVLLEKDKYKPSFNFLKCEHELFITEFTIYSICILLSRLKEFDLLNKFIQDILSSDNIIRLSIEPEEIKSIIDIENEYNLDFDDAYQYYVAFRENLIIVSYDKDFEKTEKGSKIPEDIV